MPRYKDSPEVRATKQERREKLRELLALMEVEDVRDLKSVWSARYSKTDLKQSLTISSATPSTITEIKTPTTAETVIAQRPLKQARAKWK